MQDLACDTSYAALTPDAMLDLLAAVGLHGDGRCLQLNSFENRVLRVHLEDGRVAVAKFYRPGRWSDAQILEEHAFATELREADVPVVAPWPLQRQASAPTAPGCDGTPQAPLHLAGEPPTLACSGSLRLAVTPWAGGRTPELEDPDVLRRMGLFLGRMHRVGRTRPFAHRLRWADATPARHAHDWLLQHDALPVSLKDDWDTTVRACLDAIDAAFNSLPGLQTLRLHGDCHPGNLLWSPETGPHFVDLDDACTGPAVQDLWMLLPGEREAAQGPLGWLLDGYTQACPFDERELRLIEPLRTLRMIHHSAWLARRWSDPAFPLAFPWFGTPNYWAQQITVLREQLAVMDTPSRLGAQTLPGAPLGTGDGPAFWD